MNIAGIGIDTIDIQRFSEACAKKGDRFLRKIFTETELGYANGKKDIGSHMAGKFAAKEAVKKSIPDGAEIGLGWKDIEILNHPDGKPYVRLHGHAMSLMKKNHIEQIMISISHSNTDAVSNAIAIKNG